MFGQDDPVPPFFSSDFGDFHDPAGLGVGGHVPPPLCPPVATLLISPGLYIVAAIFASLP